MIRRRARVVRVVPAPRSSSGAILGYARMFLSGAALFTLASLGCGLAGTAGQLIALRLVQGAGAAMMIPQVLSLIQRGFAGEARAR